MKILKASRIIKGAKTSEEKEKVMKGEYSYAAVNRTN